jgi:hypothetical protein
MAKLTKPIIRIHDLESNEIIDREMTAEEFAQHEADQLSEATKQAEADAKAAAKQAIADRLGLTADELKLLLG